MVILHHGRNRFDKLNVQLLVFVERHVLQVNLNVLQQHDKQHLHLARLILAEAIGALDVLQRLEQLAQQLRFERTENLGARRRQQQQVRATQRQRQLDVLEIVRALRRQFDEAGEKAHQMLHRNDFREVFPAVVRVVEDGRLACAPALGRDFGEMVDDAGHACVRRQLIGVLLPDGVGRCSVRIEVFRQFD